MMSGISRHDITANGHGRGVDGMLVLTELRLLFLPDIAGGSTTTSFLEFHTVQASILSRVYRVYSVLLLLAVVEQNMCWVALGFVVLKWRFFSFFFCEYYVESTL